MEKSNCPLRKKRCILPQRAFSITKCISTRTSSSSELSANTITGLAINKIGEVILLPMTLARLQENRVGAGAAATLTHARIKPDGAGVRRRIHRQMRFDMLEHARVVRNGAGVHQQVAPR